MSVELKKLTMDSRIKELYATPIGHDILYKVVMQLGKPEILITNPAVANMKIKTAASLTAKILDQGFWDTFLHLVNSETEVPGPLDGDITHVWWKEAVFYQIYPRSFCDSNQDGIGDLEGIISKLDYLQDLGVTALWLSPIYDSPNDDNGYDIRDYEKIMAEFGTMEEFDKLLKDVHERGMRLIMDLVVNHTSDEHRWFQEALNDPASPYCDYYYFRKDDGSGNPPNNWKSFFSGSAWNYYEKEKVWALHLFSKKQMDLNWNNPKVRDEIIGMVNGWLDKGVDGFRMDVINYISKADGLPDGNESLGNLMQFTGIEHYMYGHHLHEYLNEIHDRAFAPHQAFSVGETPGLGMKMSRLVTGEERRELDMIFSFDHLETPGHKRFDDYRYDLNYYRDYIALWLKNYGNNCWMSLFYNNHDNPRMVSKVSLNPEYTQAIETLLVCMQMTLKGTPFIFQGDEMGLSNLPFRSIEDISDLESINLYREKCEQGTAQQAFRSILAGTRDHARQPLPWNQPRREYLKQEINHEMTDIYRTLIALRKAHPVLVYGTFEMLNHKKNRFVYRRQDEKEEFLIDCNLGETKVQAYSVPAAGYDLIFPQHIKDPDLLSAYESRIYQRRK
ncbi:MAG: alpha-glucosidase [Erysipelotrichia bacterium]|nr:alpha-glucosidase [Erysipelotrichia bacterium]